MKKIISDMTDCEKYGMGHGCDADCPVLKAGLCQSPESVELYSNTQEAMSQNESREPVKVSTEYSSPQEELEVLRHYYNSTKGLYCIDKDPNEVDIEWIRENAFRLE